MAVNQSFGRMWSRTLLAGVIAVMSVGMPAAAAEVSASEEAVAPGVSNGVEGLWVTETTWIFESDALPPWLATFGSDADRKAIQDAINQGTLSEADLRSFAPSGDESVYPAGFWERNPNTMSKLYNGGNFNVRQDLALKALGGRKPFPSDIRIMDAWATPAWWQNSPLSDLANSTFGINQVIGSGGRTKVAAIYPFNGKLEKGLLWGNYKPWNGGWPSVDRAQIGGDVNAAWYWMGEMARYKMMAEIYSRIGAKGAAAEASKRFQTVGLMLTAQVADPLVLDLNHNDKIDVTGKSSAKLRKAETQAFVAEGSVMFDLMARGKKQRVEWVKGGDGFLVDDRKGEVTTAMAEHKDITGKNLFGDVDGHPGGFHKLMAMAGVKVAGPAGGIKPQVLKGKGLEGLKVWIPSDGSKLEVGTLHSLQSLGITEIGTVPKMVEANGEYLEQSYFIQNGKRYLMQEVWFARETE